MRALIAKEIKDLMRDPRIWIPFIISALVLPVMGILLSSGISESVESARTPVRAAVVDLDLSNLSRVTVGELSNQPAVSVVKVIQDVGLSNLEGIAHEYDVDAILVIPSGFEGDVLRGLRPNITVINVIKSASLMTTPKGVVLSYVINDVLGSLLLKLHNATVSLELIKFPVNTITLNYLINRNLTIAGGAEVFTRIGMTSFVMPLILMIITISILQMAATATAVENEEKTLEVLLTLPISRVSILLSKLLGSFTVALVGSSLNIIGFVLYLYIFSSTLTLPVSSESMISLTPAFNLIPTSSVIYMAASVVLTALAMAALGVTIGALSSDVRIAATISGPVVMAIVLPGYYVMFADTFKLSPVIRALLYITPFTQPLIMSKELVIAEPSSVTPLWLLASLAFSIALIALTSYAFTLEKLSKLQRSLTRFGRRGPA